MRRVFFKFGNVSIYSYPVMLYLGLALGLYAQHYAANLIQLNPARTTIATLILLVPTLIGARLLFVLANLTFYRREPQRIWRTSEGGLSMYGGILLAILFSFPLLAILEIPAGGFWDTSSFTILITVISARVGCFLNGCCGGRQASGPFAFCLPDQYGAWKRRIPTQLLEAAWALIVLIAGIRIWVFLETPGSLFLYTLGAYGAGRIWLESTRQEQDIVFGVPINQILSAALVTVSLLGLSATNWS
jgi:phosphatidylglycerol---prolipoprotein diacylglyceryl transferase